MHNLPDYVYFNHAIHVNKGVGCTTCHGAVNEMPLTMKTQTLFMQWCLQCHRDPAKTQRPDSETYSVTWEPGPKQDETGAALANGFRPLALSKKLTVQALGSVKLVQRMLYATRHRLCEKPWLRIARWGDPGRDLLIGTSSVEEAYARLLAGEQPPLMPSEASGRRSSEAELPPLNPKPR